MSALLQPLLILGLVLWFVYKFLPDYKAASNEDADRSMSASAVDANLEFEFEAEDEEEAGIIAAAITERLQGLVDEGTAESVKVNKVRGKPNDDDLSDACEMQSLL